MIIDTSTHNGHFKTKLESIPGDQPFKLLLLAPSFKFFCNYDKHVLDILDSCFAMEVQGSSGLAMETISDVFSANNLNAFLPYFSDLDWSAFTQLTIDEIKTRLTNGGCDSIDETAFTMVQLQSSYTFTFTVQQSEFVSDPEVTAEGSSSNDPANGTSTNLESVGSLVSLAVLNEVKIQDCSSKEPACEACISNSEDSERKVCYNQKHFSTKSVVQVKPFPVGSFKLQVKDPIFESLLITYGISHNYVLKRVGRILFDYLKQIFP